MPASKRQQRERRTACPAGNELIERQRLDLSHHGGARIRSFGERGSRQGSTCSSAWQMEATRAVGLRLKLWWIELRFSMVGYMKQRLLFMDGHDVMDMESLACTAYIADRLERKTEMDGLLCARTAGRRCLSSSLRLRHMASLLGSLIRMRPLVKAKWAKKQNIRTGRTWINARWNCTDLDPIVKEPKGFWFAID